MKPSFHLSFNKSLQIVFLFLLTFLPLSCNPAPATPAAYPPYILVTAAPNASPTPTPFQPSNNTPTSALPSPILPTETASPSPTVPIEPTATVDLNALFPTIAAPPVIETTGIEPTALPPLTDNETINFLLIGSDKRPGSSYRTDTLIIAILWPKEGQVSMISIPRDLWVYIPTIGMQRINVAYQSGEIYSYEGGGPALLKDTISYNLGIRIDHTAMVEFDGFRRIVDTLGGVDVPVSCSFTDWRLIDPSYDPNNENNWWLYTLNPGLIHMDGDLALWYARSRLRSSDFDRGRRQQEVLRALFDKALKTDTFSKIPQLYNDLSSSIVTDLGLADLLRMAPYAPKVANADIRGYYIRPPYVSSWITPGGASVQLPNDELLKQMLVEATTLSPRALERVAIKIEIQNGSVNSTYDVLAASRLNYAGYKTIISPSDKRDYANSALVDFTVAQDSVQQQTIISALGLVSPNIISLPNANSAVQYQVIIGNNYDPCFRPESLSH